MMPNRLAMRIALAPAASEQARAGFQEIAQTTFKRITGLELLASREDDSGSK